MEKEHSATTVHRHGLKVIFKRRNGYLKTTSTSSKTPYNGLLEQLWILARVTLATILAMFTSWKLMTSFFQSKNVQTRPTLADDFSAPQFFF